jgi:APA family basic amino acid/polyamine antiporter
MVSSSKNSGIDGQIERKLGLVTATFIVVANMIGTGIFTTSGLMAAQLPGPNWVLLCWFFGGLIAMSGAVCYAELATRMPEEGGEYLYLKQLFHPLLGFLTGWTSFIVGFSVAIAASSMAFTEYTFEGIGLQMSGSGYLLVILKKGIAVAMIFLFTFLHYLGLRAGSRVQNVLTVIKIIIILVLVAAGIAVGRGDLSALSFHVASPTEGMALGMAMMLVMFSYSGWNASSYIAGEIKRPRRTLPFSLIIGTLIVMVLYLAINLFIFKSLSYEEAKGTIAIVKLASTKSLNSWMGSVVGMIVGIGLLSSLSAFIMIGPRVYYAMAKDRLFFSFAKKVHPKYRVPGKSILFQGAIAIIMVIIGSFEQLLVYIGFALNIFPWLAIFGVFLARRKHVGDKTAVKVWGYPVVPLFYLASSLTLMCINYVNRPMESTAAVVTVLSGIPLYFLWIKKTKAKENLSIS